ncbi:DUF1573 domain-containing protein [Flavobacterium piscinae]|nr:DUF1573 domain-containing protein [Flavobacterium piscinae]
MLRKSIFALFVSASLMSCKKEDALSKIDPNSKDIPLNEYIGNPQPQPTENTVKKNTNPEANQVTPPPADGKYPAMTFNKKEHDFGVINEGDKVETTFTFTNTGEADLIIANASGSCGCTVPEFPKEPIKPGKTGKMKVSFDSNGKPGMQQKSVNITANTASGKDVLTIKANVTPKAKPAEKSAVTTQ